MERKRERETGVDMGGGFDNMMLADWSQYLLIFILLGLWVWIWICSVGGWVGGS